MLNKGLCLSCDNEKGCIFAKRFPVLECEEFSQGKKEKTTAKKRRVLNRV
jgi:hypothetical protein